MALAHAGHWLVNLLYVGPVAAIVLTLVWQSWKDKRAADRLPDDGESA